MTPRSGSTPPELPPSAVRKATIAGGSTAAAAAIAAAALIVTPFTGAHEGERLTPYRDIGGVWSVCNGETRVAMHRYAHAECQAMLSKAIRSDYAPPVLRCAPQLADNRYAFAASIDAAYNAGAVAFCRSDAAALFRLRRWRAGCLAFTGWRITARGRPVPGLVNRRRDETALCLKGVA